MIEEVKHGHLVQAKITTGTRMGNLSQMEKYLQNYPVSRYGTYILNSPKQDEFGHWKTHLWRSENEITKQATSEVKTS